MPVLCSNVCDNPNIITSDKYGFLFDPNNVDDIANAFLGFYDYPVIILTRWVMIAETLQ